MSFVDLETFFNPAKADDVLRSAFSAWGVQQSEYPKKKGWTFWSTFLACQKQAWWKYYSELEKEPKLALETGIIFHAHMQLHYLGLSERPAELHERLLASQAMPDAVALAWRVYTHYAANYQEDWFEPLAVEEWVAHPELDFCCRMDLAIQVEDNPTGLMDGVWIVDHKTAGRFDNSTLELWRHDGEVLGLQMTYLDAGLEKQYGPLRGVLINLCGKQKVPKFHREPVTFEPTKVDWFRERLIQLEKQRETLDKKDPEQWLQNNTACKNWGKCEFYEVCW